MHVDHEVVEYVAAEEQDYEEIVEEYEEIFVPEEFQEPPATDTFNLASVQGKPRSITLILQFIIYIKMLCIMLQEFYDIYIYP
jgi:hypothetical protein